VNFVVGLIHRVADLAASTAFLCDALSFKQKSTTENVIIVENGAIAIRLIADGETSLPSNAITLELHTQNMAEILAQLLSRPDISLLHQMDTLDRQQRVETLLHTTYGINIMLVQEFNEDQLDIIPPLPTSLIWQDDAEACIKKMLTLVPITFRDVARTRVTERAEMLAGEEASITVTLDNALHALTETTPLFQHPILIATLQQDGIDTTLYFQHQLC